MTLDSISGLPSSYPTRSQPFSVGLVTFSLQPSCPPIRPELTPAAPNLYRKRIATRARPEARDRSQIWNGRRQRNVASHRSIVAGGGRGCVDPAWTGIENCVGRADCWEGDGARPHDLPTSAGANFPLFLSLAVSACEIHAGRPAQPAVQKGDPTLGDLAAPAAILTGTALASRTATNSKRIAPAVRLGWLSGKLRASRRNVQELHFGFDGLDPRRGSRPWTPMLRCRR